MQTNKRRPRLALSTVSQIPNLCYRIPRPNLGRVHTTLFRTGRDRSRPVRAQLPVSTRGQLQRSFRILETTSRHGTTGRDRSRPVESVVWTLEWALGSARQITRCYHTPHWPISSPNIKAHVRFHTYSIDYTNMTIRRPIQDGMNNCRQNQCQSQKYCKAANGIHIRIKSINNGTLGTNYMSTNYKYILKTIPEFVILPPQMESQ